MLRRNIPTNHFDQMFDKMCLEFRQNVSTKCFDKIFGAQTMCFYVYFNILSKELGLVGYFAGHFVEHFVGRFVAHFVGSSRQPRVANNPAGPYGLMAIRTGARCPPERSVRQ